MKNVCLLLTGILFGIGANAQDVKTTHKFHHTTASHSMKDCVMMKDGKMMMMKNGKTMEMEKDMTMADGTVCMMDGTCKMKNGKTMVMKEGDKCDMSGKMGKMKMDKNSKMKM